MKTKVVFMHMRTGLCLIAGVVAMCSLKAETQQSDCDVYMITQDDGQFCSFTRGEHWSDGARPDETGSNKTYFIPSGKRLIAYPSTDMTFGGKMIACAGTVLQRVGSNRTVTWPELRMLSGSKYEWEATSKIAGKVVIEADEATPTTFIRPSSSNRYDLNATFESASGTGASFGTDASSFQIFNVNGDWSNFHGSAIVETNLEFIIKPNPMTIPGRIVVKNGGWFYNNENTWGYTTLGALELQDGAKITIRMFGTNQSAPVTIQDEIVVGNNVTLAWDNTSPSGVTDLSKSTKIKLFKLSAVAAARNPDFSGLKLPAYSAEPMIGPYPIGTVVVEDDPDVTGGKIVSALYDISEGKTVYTMKKANGTANAAQSAFSSGVTESDYWVTPPGCPGADTEGVLHSKETILWHRSNQREYAFANMTFVLEPGKNIYNQADSVTMGRWILFGGSEVDSYAGGTGKLCGPIYLYDHNGEAFELFAFQNTKISVCGDIHGSVDVALTTSPTHSNPVSKFDLYGDNSDFGGNLSLTSTANASFPKVSDGKYMTLSITNGNALGGTYVGTTAWKSFHVNCYGKVFVSDCVVSFSEPTRGMFVESGAQFQVTPGAVFEINVPLTLSGEIIKSGTGTLVLGGEARFVDGNPASNPEEGKNVVMINEGTLKITATNAVNGMAITFASGTKLVLDAYPTAPGMTETGFVATRWATPLTTMASDGAIPVEIELPSGLVAPETALILPICTVSPETARNITFRLPKYPGMCRIVKPRTNVDGSITLLARFEHCGTSICIR